MPTGGGICPPIGDQISRYAHAKQYKRMKKALRTLRSRVGRVMRDVERQLSSTSDSSQGALQELIGRTKRILSQKQKDKNKLYALHAPEVECLAKGKARKPYEFGVKVSITTTHKEGLVVGTRSMPGNPYDGHTLAEALEQAAILSDVKPEVAIVDRGYKGVAVDGVKIYHPGLRRGITRGLRAMIRRRSAIEPAIGHMKADGKLDRNWLKGTLGDAIHAVLCGAGHNLRMILRKLRFYCALVLLALLKRSAVLPSPHECPYHAKRIIQARLDSDRVTGVGLVVLRRGRERTRDFVDEPICRNVRLVRVRIGDDLRIAEGGRRVAEVDVERPPRRAGGATHSHACEVVEHEDAVIRSVEEPPDAHERVSECAHIAG